MARCGDVSSALATTPSWGRGREVRDEVSRAKEGSKGGAPCIHGRVLLLLRTRARLGPMTHPHTTSQCRIPMLRPHATSPCHSSTPQPHTAAPHATAPHYPPPMLQPHATAPPPPPTCLAMERSNMSLITRSFSSVVPPSLLVQLYTSPSAGRAEMYGARHQHRPTGQLHRPAPQKCPRDAAVPYRYLAVYPHPPA